MKPRSLVSSRFVWALSCVGVLFLVACIPRGTENIVLVPGAFPSPPGVPPAGASVAEDREDRTDIDWKTMPRPLPEPRWPELDHDMATVPLWPSDPACAMHNVSFALRASRTFLVSFPRSGNSWTRYLVEGATGVATGAVYAGETLIHFGMKSQMRNLNGKVILIKIHANDRRRVPDHVPVILLIRNPADSIISFFNYKKGKGSKIKWLRNVTYGAYFTKDFRDHFDLELIQWKKLAIDQLLYSQRLLVIPYEELKKDPIAQVRRALAFLGVPADEGRLECLRRYPDGPVLGLQRQVDPYTPEQKLALAKAVAEVSELLRERNFPPLPAYNLTHK
ncbi:sialate:O-sulfotransferase 1-like isoform X2 [Penaeus vannamei]|uniref:sialate:O-sulfotransferase 1-like isoform X2 n=1 Tax=Penaeus vannamei TaxID=6689 RepID=UPI00387F992F